MSRLNIQNALKNIGLPQEVQSNAYRLIFTLESKESRVYNPHAARTLRALLKQIQAPGYGENNRLNYLTVLFLGQVETLLLSCWGGFDEVNLNSMMEGLIHDLKPFAPQTKASLQEKIDSLLYRKPERIIIPIENYNPSVSLFDRSSSLMVYSSVMGYLKSTPDLSKRQSKLTFLRDRVGDSRVDDETRTLCSMISNVLSRHLNVTNTSQEEAFAQMFRKLAGTASINLFGIDSINECIKARNMAVHEGKLKKDCKILKVLGVYLWLLFNSSVAENSENEMEHARIEEEVERAVARNIWIGRIKHAVQIAASVAVLAAIGWYVVMFVTASYLGDSDIRYVRWDSSNSQLNARINEVIATKDTAQLVNIHQDIKWIDENIKE